eukprot:c32788_g1_i1 orf=1-189(+)
MVLRTVELQKPKTTYISVQSLLTNRNLATLKQDHSNEVPFLHNRRSSIHVSCADQVWFTREI